MKVFYIFSQQAAHIDFGVFSDVTTMTKEGKIYKYENELGFGDLNIHTIYTKEDEDQFLENCICLRDCGAVFLDECTEGNDAGVSEQSAKVAKQIGGTAICLGEFTIIISNLTPETEKTLTELADFIEEE